MKRVDLVDPAPPDIVVMAADLWLLLLLELGRCGAAKLWVLLMWLRCDLFFAGAGGNPEFSRARWRAASETIMMMMSWRGRAVECGEAGTHSSVNNRAVCDRQSDKSLRTGEWRREIVGLKSVGYLLYILQQDETFPCCIKPNKTVLT